MTTVRENYDRNVPFPKEKINGKLILSREKGRSFNLVRLGLGI
jgi:hypothetical protein